MLTARLPDRQPCDWSPAIEHRPRQQNRIAPAQLRNLGDIPIEGCSSWSQTCTELETATSMERHASCRRRTSSKGSSAYLLPRRRLIGRGRKWTNRRNHHRHSHLRRCYVGWLSHNSRSSNARTFIDTKERQPRQTDRPAKEKGKRSVHFIDISLKTI